MKTTILILIVLGVVAFSCNDGSRQERAQKVPDKYKSTDPYDAWESNHGIGPIAAFDLPEEIDSTLAEEGQAIYEAKCTACHKAEKRFIGPSPKGILTKRTPAWIMNMILNPQEMVEKDPMAKKLLMEFNGSPMANQNLTEDEARAILEYFRTL